MTLSDCENKPKGLSTYVFECQVVLCHAFCMWHWPICENLDLSFIWGHHQLITSLLATPCWRDPTKSKQPFLFIWKTIQNTEEWHFSFWNIFFRFRNINVFLLCKLDQLILFATKDCKMLKKQYLYKYQSSVLETWHRNCPSQKKQTDALSAVAMATLSAPVSFCPFTTS